MLVVGGASHVSIFFPKPLCDVTLVLLEEAHRATGHRFVFFPSYQSHLWKKVAVMMIV
jgi:hypothetical protein